MQQASDKDSLCETCTKVDLFSLFTGPRYFPSSPHHPSVDLTTLSALITNTNCPLCRLIHHILYTDPSSSIPVHPWPRRTDFVDPAKVQVSVQPFRADYHEEMRYADEKTRDKVATLLEVRLSPLKGAVLTDVERDLVRHHRRGYGIQLLSLDSVDPARPLQNGYQYTDTETSLKLLRGWMDTCVEKHASDTGASVCRPPSLSTSPSEQHKIRFIDVNKRSIIRKRPEGIEYAALSYVWSQARSEIPSLDVPQGSSDSLPAKVPKVIKDAISVCQKLSIPYLWVDRHCIDQSDVIGKAREIESMAFRYLNAKITLVAGGVNWQNSENDLSEEGLEPEIGLLPNAQDGRNLQRIETIQGRKYITALPSIFHQIICSAWHTRAWTMQEGQLAKRVAFFGNYDVSFLCGSGHWRESLHSGPFGHEAVLGNELDVSCNGHYMLGWAKWTKDKVWKFDDYTDLMMSYTTRVSTFESDRLNAVTGCLNFIGNAKGVGFYWGMPLTDFHYALIWTGEYDRPREAFPSWSWAGWHCLQTMHSVTPARSSDCTLTANSNGHLTTIPPRDKHTELEGLLVSLTERAHVKNQCLQRFAKISIPDYKNSSMMEITSEVAHFTFDIVAGTPRAENASLFSRGPPEVPDSFDSTASPPENIIWETGAEYQTPIARIRFTDTAGNRSQYHYPRWYDHPPALMLCFPQTLRGENLAWLLKDGISLVMILELEILEAEEGLKPFHLVLCLGIDSREEVGKRFGMFCLPKEVWEKACPKVEIVRMG
ncbi:heterokaryon incompatibility protein-domain-containing protein [Leptodontidium sp. 2 PMI_412]|nr:heterokaryon incompatibility protein-domain-containing protein [Leptodontidium sp. 2 PMI_412]